MNEPKMPDGIHAPMPRDRMSPGARKLRDTYAMKKGAPLYQKEFGYFTLEAWKKQGMPDDVPLEELFGFDPPGEYDLGGLGWCEGAFEPAFEEKIVEDRGDLEVVQDFAGRHLLCFKGRREGFMPEYLRHPVKDRKSWEEDVKWRLDPGTLERYASLDETIAEAKEAAAEGRIITQRLVGGYMYLRSLIGPVELLYAFYDMPDLIHDCMEAWLSLADAVTAKHQEHLTLDQLFIAEDICFNRGPLISPNMIRSFLLPFYGQLLDNIKSRQIDKHRHLFFHVDTDGYAPPVMPLYMEKGMDVMSPFEVASGCSVKEVRKQYPHLIMSGGIDKRVLAKNVEAIDRHLEDILPFMRERGGYVPTCDHGVPEEVPLTNYLHFRKRMQELGS